MVITNVTFIDKETGEVVLSLDWAKVEDQPFPFFNRGEGLIDSDSCAEAGDVFNGGQGI